MSRVSNSHTVSIAVTGTKLSDAARDMLSGDWLQMTGANLPSGLDLFTGQGGSGGFITGYASKMARDSGNKKMYFLGCDHGIETIFMVYNEQANSWTEAASSVPWGVEAYGSTNTAHGYEHIAFDTVNSKLYHRARTNRSLMRWDGGTTWTEFSYGSELFYSSGANANCYFPETGRILTYQVENGTNGALIAFNPSTGTFSTLVAQATGTLAGTGDPHNFAQYNPNSQVVWFGSGNGSAKTWKINASNVVTAMTDIPVALGTVGPSQVSSLAVYNPANGKFLVLRTASVWYDFDPAGSGAWTARGGTATMLSADVADTSSAYAIVACPLPEYGVIAFVKAYSRTSNAQMWLFKG